MDVLSFRWQARYGHFLRAEATVNALSYPLPPRPAVLGLVAALLGLDKDALATELQDAQIAVMGAVPVRFWHRVKLRKDPPSPLPWRVKVQQKGSESPRPEKATLLRQEWLLQPDFLIHLALPEQPARLAELTERIRERRWHFTPCMGLSELLAEVEFVAWQTAVPLAAGCHQVQCLCLAEQVRLQAAAGIGIQLLRLPQRVSRERVFSHAAYYLEHRGQPFPVETAAAWQVGDWTLLFS